MTESPEDTYAGPPPLDVDPNSDRCPVCGYSGFWRGQHASHKHPGWWDWFKKVYEPVEVMRTEWRRKNG